MDDDDPAVRAFLPAGVKRDRRHDGISNQMIWSELLYIRKKVDALETKVLFMFGTVSAIGITIAAVELIRHGFN